MFYRIKNESLIGGVCTGISNYYDIPVWLVRVLFILFFSGIPGLSISIYILIWILNEEK